MTTPNKSELLRGDGDCFRDDGINYSTIMVDKERNTK
jgi:hypothetical protein